MLYSYTNMLTVGVKGLISNSAVVEWVFC